MNVGAIWLTLVFGINWFAMGIGLVLVLFALSPLVRACEIYESIKSTSQRPEQRQRYFYSQPLYISGSMREAHFEIRTRSDQAQGSFGTIAPPPQLTMIGFQPGRRAQYVFAELHFKEN